MLPSLDSNGDRWFVNEAGQARADGEVINVAEGIESDAAAAVDQDQAVRAAQLLSGHRDRSTARLIVGVDANREPDPVLVQERLQ